MRDYRFLVLLMVVLLAACQSIPDSPQSQPKKTVLKKEEITLNQQLIASAEKGETEKVLSLLEDGAEINATDERGRTAVVAATYNNHIETVKALIQKKADINIRDNQLNNVLLYAGAEGMLDIVKLALEAGADTKLTNRYGGTALIPASERGHVDVVEELLTHSDIDVNHINNLHWTALLEAVILGDGGEKHQKIVQLLVKHGADVTIGDREGITALEHAQNRGFHKIAKLLQDVEA